MTVLYFAYGSNMCSGRLKNRVSSAAPLFRAKLDGHRLAFHKRSTDGSGKADIEQTDDDHDFVWGVVFEFDESEKRKLDEAEGLGRGYLEKMVRLASPDGTEYSALTYYAVDKDEALRPYSWYLRFVLDGARQHGLPAPYVSAIETTVCDKDPDRQRDLEASAIRC